MIQSNTHLTLSKFHELIPLEFFFKFTFGPITFAIMAVAIICIIWQEI